jgi:hypothetical protein
MSPTLGEVKIKLLGLIRGKVNRLFVSALVVMALTMGFLAFNESSSVDPLPPQASPRSARVFIESTSENYVRSEALIKPMAAFEESDYRLLSEFNMFNARTAKTMEDLAKQADKLLSQARSLMDQGDLAESRELVDQVLKNYPVAKKPAQALLAEIEEKQEKPAAK